MNLQSVKFDKAKLYKLVQLLVLGVMVAGLVLPSGVAQASGKKPKKKYYPELECSIHMPDEVYSGDELEIEVEVWNTGTDKAHNVMLYGKATPKGYFQIYACDPNCNGTTTSLGKIKPGYEKWARYWVKAPHNKAGKFKFEFWVQAYGGVNAYCGWHELSVLGGQFFKQPGEEQE